MSILCYHALDEAWQSPLAVSPEMFARHCEWLASHKKVVPLMEAASHAAPSGRLQRGQAAITFDDGFDSLFTHALPVLARLQLPSTVFLVAACANDDPHVIDWVEGAAPVNLRTLTPSQIVEMQDQGVEFGSHSLAHRNLLSLDEEECEADLRTSRELLENLLGRSVQTLAYPGGRHDEKVQRCAQRAGFAYAFAVARDDQRAGRYGIPRAGIYRNDGLTRLKIKTSPWYLPARTSRQWAKVREQVRRVRPATYST